MAIEDTLTSIDGTLKAILVIMQSATAGVAAVNAPAAATTKPRNTKASVGLLEGDAEGTRYWNLAADKKVAKTAPGAEGPIGGVELKGADYTKLEKEYAAKNASAGSTAGAAGAQTPATGASTSTTGSPSFQDVTVQMQALSKGEGGREKALKLFAKWGVEKFPQVNGKVPNDQLLKDIANVDQPEDTGGLDDLGI